MYIVVTGAAGFIGSNLVKALNARGETSILAVDNMKHGDKFRNLADCDVADYLDQDEFVARLSEGDFEDDIAAVLHQGACADTLETDGRYMLRNNYRYSVTLLDWCQNNDVPFLYASSASVYGAGTVFREERVHEAPLNVYAYSKWLFDQYARRAIADRTAQIAGFRYFNVYGMREQHKGRMASVAWHFFNQYRRDHCVKLFEGSGGYSAGEQRRDFVSIEDVVKVNLEFLDHPDRCGVYNVGSGRAATFNEVAVAIINACRAAAGESPSTLQELVAAGAISYIPFPPALVGKYQSYTEADLSRLRAAGYRAPMLTVDDGVSRYAAAMIAASA